MVAKILLVDDEPHVIKALTRVLKNDSYEIISVYSAEEGLEVLKREAIDVVVSDEKMVGMSGGEFLAEVCVTYPDTVRILLTGQPSLEAVSRAVNQGEIYRFFTKPWNDIDLKKTIHQALEKKRLREHNEDMLQKVKEQSATLRELEKEHPGISQIEKDESGAIVIDDADEIDDLASYLTSFEHDS